MKLSVVIATRDRAAFLTRALDSLAGQRDAPAFETIVADNGSSDGTAALLEERSRAPAFPLRSVYVGAPNRGAARNAGIAAARGEIVVFVDDDVVLSERFLAAHAAAHPQGSRLAVSGPILNVPSYDDRPAPRPFNYVNTFLCTCNASVRRTDLERAGGFDERFHLYGWEDTELGLRLRASGVRRAFAWDAFLYHIKPPEAETLDAVLMKTVERAQMASRLLQKDSGMRTKLATGAYALNLWRSRILPPPGLAPLYGRLARDERLPGALRALARAQLLDVTYTNELRRSLAGSVD
ncbi:MAG: glycosyltransferase [Candidatus Eremiobacteraeota bacterium]|nr:glycosyltransferase [Candidatus Eremiobacteraeota bacterium]